MMAMRAAVRAWLTERIEQSWPEPGPRRRRDTERAAGRRRPAPRIAFATAAGATPEERAAAEQAYFAHNRVAYDHLRERGFFKS
jgi:hypothetical protein